MSGQWATLTSFPYQKMIYGTLWQNIPKQSKSTYIAYSQSKKLHILTFIRLFQLIRKRTSNSNERQSN